jgi:PleD family two-component response regulator
VEIGISSTVTPRGTPNTWQTGYGCLTKGTEGMSKKILIVDDSVTMRQMVGMTLRKAGFEVIEGTNGQ